MPELYLPESNTPFGSFVAGFEPTVPELLLLLLALTPEVAPGLLDGVVPKNASLCLPEFGGIRGNQHRGILPTGETARFLLGGVCEGARAQVQNLLRGRLADRGIIRLEAAPVGEPILAGRLLVEPGQVDLLLEGRRALPTFSTSFPASRLTTVLNWNDLILPESTKKEVECLLRHLPLQDRLREFSSLSGHLRPGYRVLLHGPSGTGKTLTVALLGKSLGRPVFRVDLSMVVSKYIGETEKNLAGLFRQAERESWILFFDEADALFGKRTDVKDSKDRFANQETSYLLQRIETFNGIVILATNFRDNLDAAFLRRFETFVAYKLPDREERTLFWTTMWPEELPPGAEIDLPATAARFPLTGATIANILRAAAGMALLLGHTTINKDILFNNIHRELEKEGRQWT